MQAKALEIGETLAYQTPDARFTVRLQYARTDTYAVTVENAAGFRIDELSRTHATESEARDLAREVSKRLRDGATVAEVVAAIQPAAELISAATALLELAAAVDALTQPQQRAIRSDVNGHITRAQVATVKTLYALRDLRLGDLTYDDKIPTRVTGLDLNARGRAMRDHLHTYTAAIAA